MGGLVSKNDVATADNATKTALFAHIANANDRKNPNTNDTNAINDPGKTNIRKTKAGNSPRPVIDDFNAIKENEHKASQERHSTTVVKESTQVGDKTENANPALEDHRPGMTNKEIIQTGEKYNDKKIKDNMKKTKRKAQNMVVFKDVKNADEDVEGKKKPSAGLKTEPEEETLNAEDIVAEDMNENRKKKRKITRKVDLRKSKRKRRTLK